jgi:hydrogenase maturation factor
VYVSVVSDVLRGGIFNVIVEVAEPGEVAIAS